MKIQNKKDLKNDKKEGQQDYFTAQIEEDIDTYRPHITRIDVHHLSGQEGQQEGTQGVQCLLEVQQQGGHKIAVTHQAATVKKAIAGAIVKLRNS